MQTDQNVSDGSVAPDFRLKGDDGKEYTLSEFRGMKEVVLYFYPKDMTPGCTKEACDFRDSAQKLGQAEAQVLGVSNDDVQSHGRFRSANSLNFPLLADTDGSVSRAYGVYKESESEGEKSWGIERSTFVIGKDGVVKKAFRKVKVDGHIDEVLRSL